MKKFFKKPERQKPTVKDYHTEILFGQSGNLLIKKYLLSEKPFMIARIGGTEIKCVDYYVRRRLNKLFPKSYKKRILEEGAHLSGIYPQTNELFDEFSMIFIQALKDTDVMAVWYNIGEDELCKTYCPDSRLIFLEVLKPFFFNLPWSEGLKGKKVLVIMPFDETVKSQYKKRKLLFENQSILPEFELVTYKALQGMGGGNGEYDIWTHAYNKMCEDIKNMDFDIALISAGAFGLPLASYIKNMGKQSIHVGGALQLLFGLKGKRWDQMEEYTQFYNEHWVYPPASSKPKNTQIIDQYEGMAAYWT